ncbi:hypothetical protein [Haliangium sp.]|uniref:hypothetical protein n=1 Tax=Haliangium sp. TaxID=2663208 RepID=UPI003D0CC53E
MDLAKLFKAGLLKFLGKSVDIGGAALLGGAWPIVKPALEPVIELLQRRLGQRLTTANEHIEAALAEFERDQHLQQVFLGALQRGLLPVLDQLRATRGELDEGLWHLATLVGRFRGEVDEHLEQLGRRLEQGVSVTGFSPEALAQLAEEVARQARATEKMYVVASQDAARFSIGRIVRHAYRMQTRALVAMQRGQVEAALDELEAGRLLVATLLREAPADLPLRLLMGFLLKSSAQALAQGGDHAGAESALDAALEVFEVIEHDVPPDHKSANDLAVALHGLGNVLLERGNPQAALERLRAAAAIAPTNPYIWHDIYVAQLDSDHPDVDEMARALDRVRANATGAEDLTPDYLASLQQRLDGLR